MDDRSYRLSIALELDPMAPRNHHDACAWLGAKIGVSADQVMNWADGISHPTEEQQLRLAEALGVTIEWLAHGIDG